MSTVPVAIPHRRSRFGGPGRVLFTGAAVAALIATGAHAQGAAVASPDPTPIAIPAPSAAPPEVDDSDFAPRTTATTPEATGAVPSPAATGDAVPPAPAPTVTALAPVPAALTALLAQTGPASELRLSSADRGALIEFYAARDGEPIWIENGRFSSKAEAAMARIAAADGDALNPRDFKLPAQPSSGEAAEIARAEAQLTTAALAYARTAWSGRIQPSVVSPSITAKPDPFDAAAALATFENAPDIVAALDGFNPQHPQFQALRKLLASARADETDQPERPKIGFGKLLKPGEEDPRVPLLRTRLGLDGPANDTFYDDVLADAVIAFQKSNKIGASGLINRQTVRALDAGARPRRDTDLIEMNMERWRWMPRDLGARHVFVDIPAFQLHIMQDGQSIYETRVIVGKATNQTPVFSNAIDHIVVNPYWNVPVSIAMKEMRNGSLRGFEVVDSRGRKVENVDWSLVAAQKLRIRQPPGERNALGHIKFMFPNSHSVYLHDTPTRTLFQRDARALSHGCVRVDKPLEFADALAGDQGLGGARLKGMIGGKERSLGLTTSIPVHLTYFTAWVDENGELRTRKDLYSLDARLHAALRGEPLPPLPVEPAPKVAKAKPKKPAPTAQASVAPAAVPAPVQQSSWLSRLFGDSR
jgi:murein L,D-transpeptidase YcbB/YkuD